MIIEVIIRRDDDYISILWVLWRAYSGQMTAEAKKTRLNKLEE